MYLLEKRKREKEKYKSGSSNTVLKAVTFYFNSVCLFVKSLRFYDISFFLFLFEDKLIK